MPQNQKYWVYAPGENANKWEEFYSDGIMAIGWSEILGNLSNYNSKKGIASKLQHYYKDGGSHKNDALTCWNFKENIGIGDIIIAKKGRNEYLGYGVVKSGYFYNPDGLHYSNQRKVDWRIKGNWKSNHNIVLKTLTDITSYKGYIEYINNLFKITSTTRSPMVIDRHFEFTPGHNVLKETTKANYLRKENVIDLFHNKMQTISYQQLIKKYGANNVGTEVNTGHGTQIDLVIKNKNEFVFYEFKTSGNIKNCIREALPQLLEYAYWKKKNSVEKLIIVSQNPITAEAKDYLNLLRNEFNIKIFYCWFNAKKEQLELNKLY